MGSLEEIRLKRKLVASRVAFFSLVVALVILGVFFQMRLKNSAGAYNPYLHTIILFPDKISPFYACDTAMHEYGHYVWYVEMNDTQRQNWIRLYENSILDERFVSSYAQTSAVEDFAETYAEAWHCIKDSDDLKEQLPEKALFMQEIW